MNVVVVESPAKAKTINKYLGRGYEVLASFGHVRDLPAKNGSVDPDHNFTMIWEVDPKAQKRLNDIAQAVKGADKLILATDPDREGEAISWHVLEVLKQKKALKDQNVERVVFNAITKQSVDRGDGATRARSMAPWSTPIWRVARSITWSGSRFRPCSGASCRARARPAGCSPWRCGWCASASSRSRNSCRASTGPWSQRWRRRAATRSKPGWSVPMGKKIQRLDIGSGAEAQAFKSALEHAAFTVATVEAKPTKRNPYPPFTTSTLQQEASRKLGFAPAHTMRIAQRLYEGRRHWRRYRRAHHLYANGWRADRRGSAAVDPQGDRPGLRRTLRAGRAAHAIRPKPRTPRKRTRRSGRPTSAAVPATSRATSMPSRPNSTS